MPTDSLTFNPLGTWGQLGLEALKGYSRDQVSKRRDTISKAMSGDEDAGLELARNQINELPTMGSIKSGVPFNRYAKVMAGENPLDMSRLELGKYVQELGPDIRVKNSELMGAQAIDQFKTTDPGEIVRAHLAAAGHTRQPEIKIVPNSSAMGGATIPSEGKIYLGGSNPWELKTFQHPEEALGGTAKHEALHLDQYWKDPNTPYASETLTDPRMEKSNAILSDSGFFDKHKIEAVLRHAKENPGSVKLPGYAENLLSQGHSPKALAEVLSGDQKFLSSLGQQLRTAVGNRGFRGNNPYLADTWQSTGHFKGYRGEMEIPVHELGKMQADAGGDIHPDWLDRFPDLKARQKEYKSPVQLTPNASVAQVPEVASPWAALAAGAGGTAAIYGLKKLTDKGDQGLGQNAAQAEGSDDDQLVQQYAAKHRKLHSPGW